MPKQRLVILSDLHCGSVYGLTPTGWLSVESSEPGNNALMVRTAPERRACWDWFSREIKSLGKINKLVLNGDAIEGKALRQGGLELLTSDEGEQVGIAKRVIEFVNADEVAAIYGTAYHTGMGVDWENFLGDKLAFPVGGQDYYKINGKTFDFKHHLSSSSVPHGRHTPLSREMLWNILWAAKGEFPLADVLIRSHVHYHVVAGGTDWLAMSTPALQSPGTRYGGRRMAGIVDYGFVVFDVAANGDYSYQAHLLHGANAPWAQTAVEW